MERCDVCRGAWMVGGDFGGWDIQCSCVSLSMAVGEGAVGEGAPVFFPSPHAPAWDPESEGAEG